MKLPATDAALTDRVGRRAPAILRAFPSLASREFRVFWLGMVPAMIAWQMNIVAAGYAAFILSGSATALGLVSLAIGLPSLFLSLVGGVVADFWPRRTVLLLTQFVFSVAAGGTAALSFAGVLQVWHLVVLGLIQGVVSSFNMPARQAYVAELAGPQLLRNAVALNNAGLNFSRIIGPAIAGGLLAIPTIGVGGVFAVMSALYFGVFASILRLPKRSPSAEGAKRSSRGRGWEELLSGVRYLRSSPVLVALLGLAAVPVVFGLPYQSLMPLFSERIFAVGASGLGILMAAVGVGALGGSVTIAVSSGFPRPAALQLGLGVGFGLSLIAFALAPTFWLAVVLMLLVGFCSSSYNVLNNTLLMTNADPRLYGRVMSLYMLTFSMMPIGAMAAAWIADHIGGRPTIAGGGAIVAAVVAGVAAFYRPYRTIR